MGLSANQNARISSRRNRGLLEVNDKQPEWRGLMFVFAIPISALNACSG
jgi:hypothetical protein